METIVRACKTAKNKVEIWSYDKAYNMCLLDKKTRIDSPYMLPCGSWYSLGRVLSHIHKINAKSKRTAPAPTREPININFFDPDPSNTKECPVFYFQAFYVLLKSFSHSAQHSVLKIPSMDLPVVGISHTHVDWSWITWDDGHEGQVPENSHEKHNFLYQLHKETQTDSRK